MVESGRGKLRGVEEQGRSALGQRGRHFVSLMLAAIAAACVPTSQVPEVTQWTPLAVQFSEQLNATPSPLAVVHAAPKGPTAAGSIVSVVFSQPLRSLEASSNDRLPPIRLNPAVPGTWQWVGTNAVQFRTVAPQLPPATAFEVTVPGQVAALGGQILGSDYVFQFATPRPEPVTFEPREGSDDVDPNVRLKLEFNQEVPALQVERLGVLTVNKRAVAFSASLDAEFKQRVWVKAKERAPLGSEVVFHLQPGVHGEGALVSETAFNWTFKTRSAPSVKFGCGWSECVPGAALWVETATPMRARDLRAHLQVTPATSVEWSPWFDGDEFVTSLQASVRLLARSTYRIEVTPGFSDRYGQPLTAGAAQSFRTGDYPPSLAIGAEGEIVQTRVVRPVPIRARNIPRYRLTTGAVSPAFVAEYYDHPWEMLETIEFPGMVSRWVNDAPPNKIVDQRVDLLEILGRGTQASAVQSGAVQPSTTPRGAVLLDARYVDATGQQQRQTKLLQVTDLGLTAKLSRAGSLVWVTSLSGGVPVPGADVEVWRGGEKVHSYKADAEGLAQVPAADFSPEFYDASESTALVARHGGDWTARSERSIIGPWSMPVTPELGPEQKLTMFMFTERGVYRPGDRLWLKGIARGNDEVGGGNTVVRGKFTLVLHSPNAEEVSRQVVEAGEFGTFATQFAVPASGSLGQWSIEVADEGAAKGSAESLAAASFDVAEYQPAEFKVLSEFAQPEYMAGATAHMSAGAEYLFGAPLAGAEARFTLSYESAWFAPPLSTGYTCDDSAYRADMDSESPRAGLLAEVNVKLDAKGQATLTHKLELPDQFEPKRLRLEVEASDVSHQAITGSSLALLHPAEFYLALRDFEDWFVNAPNKVRPNVLALTPEGARLTGKRVNIELFRRRWTAVQQEWEGGFRDVSQRVDDSVGRCTLTTRNEPTECALQVVEGGYYVLRATSADAQGHRVQASQSFYAMGGGRSSWREDATNGTVELVANKAVYEVGETAKVLIKSPFERAEALITIERAGILEHRRVTLSGATPTIEVPITDRLRPNAYVSVHLLGVVDKKQPQTTRGRDLFRVGTTELRLNAAARKLAVTITPVRRDYMPGQTVEADVVVKDATGRPARAELSVYAVDEGVLMLTGYQVPDPVGAFTAPRPLRVATLESRDDLARVIDAPALEGSDKGSEGGGGGGDVRRQFRQSAYFNPALLTDAQGRAHFAFKLPDNLTTYRLMAVAVSADDRYGSGKSEVRVSKPLMARPALPRFVRAGDRFLASVAVSTKASSERTVRVGLDAQGLIIEGPREKELTVLADGVAEVTFPVRADVAGEASLSFDVRGSKEHDAVTLKRTVQSPARLEAVAAYGETSGVAGQRLGELAEVRSDQGGLEVSVASTRLIGLDASMQQLVEYPYACTEQLASRLLPLLPLEQLAQAFGFEAPKDVRQVAERSVRQILLRQRGDGGFGFWPEAPHSHPWLSAYALWALGIAKEHGINVEESVFLRGTKYLHADLLHRPEPTQSLATQRPKELDAFAVWVLAELGQPELANIERLFEHRMEMSLDGVAWLLLAAERLHAPEALRTPLIELLNASITLDGNRARVTDPIKRGFEWTLASPLRTQALVLRALLASDPQHALAGKLATELLAQRQAGSWRTTQESAVALLALNDYWRAQEAAVPNFKGSVWVGSDRILQQPFVGRQTAAVVKRVPMNRVRQAGGLDVVFQREATNDEPAQGTLFYEARLSYAPTTLPTTPLDRGFAIEKTIRPASAAELPKLLQSLGADVARVPVGSLAVVDVTVVTPIARRFVVVDDPLPAGFEAVDSSLLTNSARVGDLESTALTGFSDAWYRRELRDDRALFFVDQMEPGMYHYRYLARATTRGKFVVPATRALEMYQPEIYGRTATRVVEVFEASAPAPAAATPQSAHGSPR